MKTAHLNNKLSITNSQALGCGQKVLPNEHEIPKEDEGNCTPYPVNTKRDGNSLGTNTSTKNFRK